MTNFSSAFEQVKKLVEDFQSNESKFLSSDYQEAEVRRDFIDKFLFALGWDVYHNEQKNPYEQEVKVEKGVYVGKQQKRADYAFHLAPNFRDVRFYIEAKKPSRNLSNADDYFQSIRYGWNAGTQITFLTDFEEFHILDCRIKPNISSILNYQIKKYHYSDFLTEEKFSEIYWLLSREAVVNNSLEKFAESLPKPKGKAILKGTHRGIYQSIDEAFLEELDEIRDSLAKAFKKANPHLESEPLTEMTQRLIDRLVFIRFLEDKQIEPNHYVSEFANSKSAWKDFKIASRKLDAKYNGVVFKKHTIDGDNFIAPDDKTFSTICEELAHINSPYNFDIIPIHILGSIYERFLGKVVVATDKRVRIEEKPEVRKAGGVYYTPQYIVNYIVDNTIGKLIEGKTPKEISKMRFADISCGSGSFLITVFDRLLEHHRKWYQDNPEQAKKDGCYFQDGKWVLSLKQKQKILTNNIYGVDLDHQAVEVTQLSLYLKLLEDETTATAQDTWVMFKEQLLPNLNNNIVCGNSLIGRDICEGNLFSHDEEIKLKPMNFEDAFPEVMSKGGFDAIVGNPPYGRIASDNPAANYLRENYTSVEFKIDTFSLFVERTLKIGFKKLGLIIPNNLMTNQTERKLRKMMLTETNIVEIVNHKYSVFKDAIIHTMLLFLDKPKTVENEIVFVEESKNGETEKFKISQSKFLLEEDFSLVGRLLSDKNRLFVKIRNKGTRLDQLCEVKQAIKTGDDSLYLSNNKSKSNYQRVLGGKEMNRYTINYQGRYVDYGKHLACPRDPKIFEVDEKIVIRETGSRITATLDISKYYLLSSVYSCFNLTNTKENIRYILSILNSTLIQYYMQLLCFDNNLGAFTKARIFHYQQLPIVRIDFSEQNQKSTHDKLTQLVDQMLESKKQLANAKTESEKEYLEKKRNAIDKQIDRLVYELYGLTDEEIKIVEGS